MQLLTSAPSVSSEEREQILQTIEMFEVITQANPQDCQSMEILKDAYQRVGKTEEFLGIARKLGDAYAELGQYSAAMLEYEGILKNAPDSPEVVAALGEVEEKLQKAGQLKPAASSDAGGIDLDFRAAVSDSSTLMTTAATQRAEVRAAAGRGGATVNDLALRDDGNNALAKILTQHRIVSDDVVGAALDRVHAKNKDLAPNTMAMSLIDEIARRGSYETDFLLSGILDRCKFAFAPLDYYDIDRSIVRMLPESLTLGRLMLPFDMMSRTVMIAMANPFDALGKEAAQQLLDYNVQWHLASPSAIFRVLKETYRIEK
ncbi:MAG: hypothetical protein K8R23_06995 [Chthoniobacter sp.]|nr:hypothetical protein [Chthoniobacter sp.]